jgi:hypothetical protein
VSNINVPRTFLGTKRNPTQAHGASVGLNYLQEALPMMRPIPRVKVGTEPVTSPIKQINVEIRMYINLSFI